MNPSSYTLRVNDTRDAWFTPGRDTFVTQGASSYLLATTPAVSYDWDASANYGSTSKSSCRGPFSRFSCSAPAPTTPPTPTPTPSCGISIPATLTMNANSSVVMNVTVTSQTGGIVDQVNFISTIPSRVSASSPNLIAPFSTTLTSNTSAGSASITAYGFMNGNTATYRCFDTSVVTVLAPIPTAVPPCQVTTSPSVLNLVDGTTGGVSAFVSSGLGSATVNRMDFGSYNTVIAAVGPSSDVTSPYNTSVFAQNPGSTAVWGTATLSDGRVCQTTAASDTNVNVTAPTPPPPGTPTPTRVPTPTTVPPCQVTTSPAVLNLVDGTTGGVSASVSSGLGSATVNRMDFGSYNTTIATVSPTFDLSGSFSTTVFAQNPGSTAVWGTATLSDGRICQTTAATDTNVTVIPPPTVAPGTPTPTRVPTPTPVLLCQVTTSPSTLNLVDGTSGGVSASVTSGLGSATVNRMDFGSYNTTIATVSPTFDTTSPTYTTTVFAQNPGSTAVWGTATLSDGRVCQSTAATDTNVNVTAPTPLPGTPTPTRTPTPLRTPTPTTIVLPTNTPTRTPTPSRTPTPTIACPPPPPAPIPDPPTYNSIHLTNVFSGDVIHRYTSNLDPNPPPSYNGDVTTNDDYDDPVACNPGTTYYYQAWRTVGACTSRSGYSGPASCLDYPDWYQTSGNVTANGAVRNEVPVTVSTFGLIIGTSVNWGGTGIQSAETIIHPSVVTNPGYSGFYNSAVNRAGSNKVNSSVSPLDIDSVSGTAVDGVVYVENNANNLTLSSTTLNKNMVLIYSGTGTVTINGDIRIGAGATTFVLLAKGDIKVSNTVGTPDASPVTDNLQGIYIAGGKFYDTDGDEAGKTLRVNGTVVGLRGVSLDRNSSTDVYPKDYFVFNPGYIMNLPLGLRVSTRFFNELAP